MRQALFTMTTAYDLYCHPAEISHHTPTLTSRRGDAKLVIPRGTRVGVNHEVLLYGDKQYYFPPAVLNTASKERD